MKSRFMRGAKIGVILGLGIGFILDLLVWGLTEPFFGQGVAFLSAVTILIVVTLASSIALGLIFAIIGALSK